MNKLYKILLLTILVVFLVGGFSQVLATDITLWGWWDVRMDLFKEIARDFEAENPEIKIEVVSMPDDTLWQKALPAIASGQGPTLILADSGKYFQFLKRGILEPYSQEYFPQDWVEENYPNAPWDQQLRYKGDYYMFPGGYIADILIYNKEHFKEAGLDPENPPKTWSELVEVGKKLTRVDESGNFDRAGFVPSTEYELLTYIYQAGGNIIKVQEDGTRIATMNTPEVRKALKFYTDLFIEHNITSYEMPLADQALGTEKASMSVASGWIIGEIMTNYPEVYDNLGYAIPPVPEGVNSLSGRKDAVLLLMANARRPEEEKAAGMEFLKYIYKDNDKFLREYSKLLTAVPPKKSLLDNEEILDMPGMDVNVEAVQNQKGPLGLTLEVDAVLTKTVERVILQGMSIEDTLDLANNEIQNLIDEGVLDNLF